MDSLYKCLDDAISHIDDYIGAREKRISNLRTRLGATKENAARYDIMYDMYREYMSYSNDSAMKYIGNCIELATRMNDPRKVAMCRIKLAYQCSTTGFYAEAFKVLEGIDTTALDRHELGEYYSACCHAYGEMGYYTHLNLFKKGYSNKSAEYGNKILSVLSDDDDLYQQRLEMVYFNKGDMAKAIAVNDRRMAKVSPDSRDFAIVAFYRFLYYRKAGDQDSANYWLVRSAICDVRHAVMDQASMWELARLLSDDENELRRSYSYISFANECAERFGTRVRNMQISSVFQAIDRSYQAANQRKTNQLRMFLVVTVLLAVFILLLFLYVNRQRKYLEQTKKELSGKNTELSEANTQLSELNTQLSLLNKKMSEANLKLHDSNRVKDEYIGRFLRLCSMYIDKMDGFRKRVAKLIKSREYDALTRMLREQETKDTELGLLYTDFDTAFLHLYPDFVDKFNALLREEERIVLPDKKVLNTTLRIFALIRLGVEDSSKIAEFLHYSVNTIYNYRARIKSGVLGDRETFEERVKQIGLEA